MQHIVYEHPLGDERHPGIAIVHPAHPDMDLVTLAAQVVPEGASWVITEVPMYDSTTRDRLRLVDGAVVVV